MSALSPPSQPALPLVPLLAAATGPSRRDEAGDRGISPSAPCVEPTPAVCSARGVHVEEVRCRTILNRSRGGGFAEYTLNAYQGCAFGCSFCYVPVLRARRGMPDQRAWGAWVQVKVNAADALRREMQRVPETARIVIGTAADSWQPVEKRYGVTRRVLEELALYPNRVHIMTRSPLLIRDIDVLRRMADVSVGVSLSTFDEDARRVFEPHAPAVAGRVALLRRLLAAGVRTRLFWCPLLYGVSDTHEGVSRYLTTAAEIGVGKVVWDRLSYGDALGAEHMRLLRVYRERTGRHAEPSLPRAELRAEIARQAAALGIECG